MAFPKRTFLAAMVALIVFVVWAVVWVPHEPPRIALNEYDAMLWVRNLTRAEHSYAAQYADAGFACNFKDLDERLLADNSGVLDGYHFEIRCPQGSTPKVNSYTVIAVPVRPGFTGRVAFCADQSGEVWYSKNGLADCLVTHQSVTADADEPIKTNQYDAVGTIWRLNEAEHNYAAQHPDAGFACNFTDLGERGPVTSSRIWDDYHFEVRCAGGSGGPKVRSYTITAVPLEPGTNGRFAFCSDQSGEIWQSENGLADCLTTRKRLDATAWF